MIKILTKILQYSFLPFSVMITGKLVGVIIAANMLDTTVEIGNDLGGKYMVQLYVADYDNVLFINRISNICMTILLAIGIISIMIYYKYYIAPKKSVACNLKKKTAQEWLLQGNDGVLQLFIWFMYFFLSSYVLIKDYQGPDKFSVVAIVGAFAFSIIVVLHEKIENLLKNFYTVCYAKN